MGYYIEEKSTGEGISRFGLVNTVQQLMEDGAKPDDGNMFQENLICVVDNGAFTAIGYCYNQQEYEYFRAGFISGSDKRPHKWMVYPHAVKQSGYKPRS
jgi:hypothetical protein